MLQLHAMHAVILASVMNREFFVNLIGNFFFLKYWSRKRSFQQKTTQNLSFSTWVHYNAKWRKHSTI